MLKSHKQRKKAPRVPKSKYGQNAKKTKPPAWDGRCMDHRGIEKRGYLTKEVADKAALGLMMSADPAKGPRHTINAYFCGVCSRYHLGHGSRL